MQKLVPVEDAKTLLEQAKDWGVWKWLTEKKRVRETADNAWAALEEAEQKVKASWNDDLKKAYQELVAEAALAENPRAKRQYEKAREEARGVDPQIKSAAARLKQADDEAFRARMDAEKTFEEAEKRLSTGMAREGSRQAIEAYGMREKVIRKFEAAARSGQASPGKT
jgi:hypothetical protein